MTSGILSQITLAGAMGYFLAICLDFAFSLYDPLKQEELLSWWHHLVAGVWMAYSIIFNFIGRHAHGKTPYGLSVGVCTAPHHHPSAAIGQGATLHGMWHGAVSQNGRRCEQRDNCPTLTVQKCLSPVAKDKQYELLAIV